MTRRVRKPINQINVVPYIDVMLVLLVIFMVTAPLVSPGQIELPSVGSKLVVPVEPLEVSLGPNKVLMLFDQATKAPASRVTKEQLVARVLDKQQGRPDQPVVIRADKNARYEDVMEILDVLQRNGVRKVGLLARPTS
jgi:biopolymer transport protein TolR